MILRIFKSTLALMVLYSFAPQYAFSALWYVDNNAKGLNTGKSWQDAWISLSNIFWSMIQPGDVLYISGGTSSKNYYEGLSIGVSGSNGNPITIRVGQEPGHNGVAIINGLLNFNSYTDITVNGEYNGGRNIVITGSTSSGVFAKKPHRLTLTYLDINNNGDSANDSGVRFMPPSSPASDRAVGTTISYSLIRNNYQDGINYVRGNCVDFNELIIHNNIIEGNGDDGMEIHCGVVYDNIIRNRVYSGASSHADGIQGVKGYWKIYNNKIYDYDNAMIFIETTETSVSNIYIYNNLLYLDDLTPSYTRGLHLKAYRSDASNVTWSDIYVYNNTIANFTDYIGFRMSSQLVGGGTFSVSSSFTKNNIFYNNSNNVAMGFGMQHDYNWYSGTTNEGELNGISGFSENPFVNVKGSDFSLINSSSAIDNGSTLDQPYNIDIVGTSRPQGLAYDMGAFEFINVLNDNSPPSSPSFLIITN